MEDDPANGRESSHFAHAKGMNESVNGDYHDQKNSSNNEKWVQEKLIPNIVVFDKAP